MLLRLLLILVVCYYRYFGKSSLPLACRLKMLSQVVVSPFSICLQAASMLMFFFPALYIEFCFIQETRTPSVIRMICTMLFLILLSCFLLRTQLRGMFVVKSGRAGGQGNGGRIPSHVGVSLECCI